MTSLSKVSSASEGSGAAVADDSNDDEKDPPQQRLERSASSRNDDEKDPPQQRLERSASSRLREINSRDTSRSADEQELRRKLVPKLAARAYHLENSNSWFEDWLQYQKNTHPVFGLCFHHRFHPVLNPQRLIILIGSMAVGLAITNIFYFIFFGGQIAGGEEEEEEERGSSAYITFGYGDWDFRVQKFVLCLWTVGSFLHSLFDLLIWNLAACACFRPGGQFGHNRFCQNIGIYLAVFLVVVVVFLATTAVVLRVNEESVRIAEEQRAVGGGGNNDENDLYESANEFSFLIAYAVELGFALFVFYTVTSTVFFSGILGCGRIPLIGGRPYEVRREAAQKEEISPSPEAPEAPEADEEAVEYWLEEDAVEVVAVSHTVSVI